MSNDLLGSRTLILGFIAVLGIVASQPAAGDASRIDPDGTRISPDPIGGPATPSAIKKTSSGALDASFAGDGTVMTFVPPILEEPEYNTDIPEAVAIDGQGGILVAGTGTTHRFALERFTTDGTLDTTFGTDGLATFPMPDNSHLNGMVVQPDGRILVAGDFNTLSATMARFMPDGSLDPNFGQGGVVQQAEPRGGATDIALLPDGRIVLVGGNLGRTLRFARYESNGLPDNTFGTNGVVDTGVTPGGPTDTVRQADGRFVFAFQSGQTTKVVRFEADGSSDAGFGPGGVVTLPFIALEPAVVAQPDGKIVVGGASFRELGGFPPDLELLDFQIARLHPDGSLDEDFGGDGTGFVTTHLQGRSAIDALALDAQGRLVAAGTVVKNSGASNFGLARYAPDGSLDPSFGKSGKTTADVDGHLDDRVRAMAVQPDGRLVVVGDVTIDRPGLLDSFAWGLARFHP